MPVKGTAQTGGKPPCMCVCVGGGVGPLNPQGGNMGAKKQVLR